MAIGDVITILRDGKFRAEARVSDIDVPWIVREMLGSDPVSNFLEPGRTFGAPVLEAEHITCVNAAGNAVVNDVTFNVHAGEIVGIYGLMGPDEPNCSSACWVLSATTSVNCGSTASQFHSA